jgi:trimethylguanosine synthase
VHIVLRSLSQIATDLGALASPRATTLIDLFAGAGGNAIAFALSGRWDRVVAVERDPATLACAQHNATVMGVPAGHITWVLGDCFDYLAALATPAGSGTESKVDGSLAFLDPSAAVVFGSPPWGGVSYRDHSIFDLEKMEPYGLPKLHVACKGFDHALYLPRTSDLRQIAALAPDGGQIEVVQYCMWGASKALVAYIPGFQGGQSRHKRQTIAGANDEVTDGLP